MRRFMKVFAFLMLGLGLIAAPGYWTYVNFLSASTLTKQLVFDREISGNKADAGGHMSVYLTPDMNPLQILGWLEVAPPAGQSTGGNPNLDVAVRSGRQHIWAATATVVPNFSPASSAAQPRAIGVNLGTLHVVAPGDYTISGSVDRSGRMQTRRIFLEVRRDVIDIRWGIFGVGILLILGAVILYRVADS